MQVLEFPSDILEENGMANPSVTSRVLEERVNNHIMFFKIALSGVFIWLGWITVLMFQTKSAVTNIAKVEANAPAQIATAILRSPAKTPEQATDSLAAVSAVLKTAHPEKHRLSPSALTPVSERLAAIARTYPELPQVWQTTGTFIQYKSEALVPEATRILQVAQNKTCKVELGARVLFSNCQLSLEEVASHYQNNIYNGHQAPFVFVKCIVIYTGGNLPYGSLIFRDCLFRFDIQKVPSPYGQSIMMLLASSTGADITIPPSAATHS